MSTFINHGRIINTDYGIRLRLCRDRLGLSQQSMAKLVGMSQSNITKLERQEISLTLEAAEQICKAVPEIDFIWLITGHEK